ncbi:MAG TPA: T9SS type A sorting domain-containing protein [Bacteroidia bacterium]|nr:T9SS type A sorting domain-containing protein [Bacteroidia bacterium]
MKKTLLPLICFTLFSFQFSIAQNKFIAAKPTGKAAPFQAAKATVACDTIFSFPTNVGWTSGLAFDGTYFYASDFLSPYIYKYDINGIPSGTLPNPGINSMGGGDLDFDGTYLWFIVENDGIIYKLDPSSGSVILQYNLPTSNLDPNNFGCAWDNGFIWITEYLDQTLMRIDASTGALVDSFEINRQVLPLKIFNNNLYGLEVFGPTGEQLLHFDKSNGTVIDSMPWCLDYPLGLCSANNHVWGLNSQSTNRVYEFDSLFLSVKNIIPGLSDFSVYPNPVKDKMILNFTLEKTAGMQIDIYNAVNQKMKTFFQQKQTAGKHQLSFDIKKFPAGIYFLKIFAGEKFLVKKIIKM